MIEKLLSCAKRTDNGEWVEGYYEFYVNHETPNGRHIISFYSVEDDHMIAVEIDPDTLCSCLSKRDISGKLIFEGNIIRWSDETDMYIGLICFSEYAHLDAQTKEYPCGDYGFYIQWSGKSAGGLAYSKTLRNDILYWLGTGKIEVIGNKWDNPELLHYQRCHECGTYCLKDDMPYIGKKYYCNGCFADLYAE